MVYYILAEPGFKSSSWYNQILYGIKTEKHLKRIKTIHVSDVSDFHSLNIDNCDTLLLIGSNEKWILDSITVCEQYFENRIIVLGNIKRGFSDKKFSIVSGDISSDVVLMHNYLKHYNKNKIALYGVNPNSASDMCRKDSFLNLCNNSHKDIYYNLGSLSECYESFKQNESEYDGIICVNDYAAISLISHLKQKRAFVVSLSGTQLASLHNPSITSLKINYSEFGAACIELNRLFTKNKNIASVDVYISASLCLGESTNYLPLPATLSSNATVFKPSDSFYTDKEIKQMINIEKLLISCSDEDLRLIERILQNATYGELSEEFYMSVSGIKYKLKKMFDVCGITNKTAFSELLKSYIKY